jgi:hypothetical protein
MNTASERTEELSRWRALVALMEFEDPPRSGSDVQIEAGVHIRHIDTGYVTDAA